MHPHKYLQTSFNLFKKTTALLTISAALSGCALLQGGPPPSPPPMPVEVITIEETAIPDMSQYLARLESRNAVTLKPQVTGRIARILVEPGQMVFAGQPIIQLDASELQAEVYTRQEEIAVAISRAQQAEGILKASVALKQSSLSNIEYQEKQLARTKLLLEKKAASPAELEKVTDTTNKAHTDLEINNGQIASQQSAVQAARKSVHSAQASLLKQQTVLGYYTIRAPFSGIVGDIPAREGDVVSPSMTLAEIANATQLEINLAVPVEQAQKLKPGLQIRVMSADSNQTGLAAISSVNPIANAATQTVLVKAKLMNTGQLFSVDQLVNAFIVWKESKGIIIPLSSVMHAAGVDFVFVVSSGKDGKSTVKQRPVELGELQKLGYVVKRGLKPGEKIVSIGIQKLQDEMIIQELPSSTKKPPAVTTEVKAPDSKPGLKLPLAMPQTKAPTTPVVKKATSNAH